MYSNNSNGSRAASARGFILFAMLAMGLGAIAAPADAAPFAYVTETGLCFCPKCGSNVLVFDTELALQQA